jgi:hypothetical protein
MFAVSHAPWLLAFTHGDAPDRGVIAGLLFIHTDFDKRYARAIWRNLRIANPVELEDVFLSDGTLLGLG